ncbi:MAG: trigger factor [Campylobacterota bacterium]|nr:trigger factor [Campylobacterota bacterium]
MNITVEKIDDINFIITGTVDNRVIEEKVSKLKEAAKATVSDAPTDDSFEQDAAGEVFREFIEAGIKEANLKVEDLLGQPGLKKYEKQENSVFFEVDVAISQEINTDINYADVIPEYTKPKADPKAVEEKLEEFAKQQAPFSAIEHAKAVENGDVTVIDFTGYMDGKPFEGGSAEKFNLRIGSNSFIPGFEEQLIGMEYKEERTITVTFPEDYQSKELAGKETQFLIKLHEIQEQKAVVSDDAFAQRILNDKTATIDTLKEKLADQITAQDLTDLYNNELKPKLIEGLLSKFEFPLPNNIVEQEIDAKVREKLQHFSQEEQQSYIENKEKLHEFRDSIRDEARDGIKIAMIIEVLAKKEGIDVDEQEVLAALAHHAMMTGQNAQEIEKYYRENNLMTSAKLGLTEDKLFGQILGFHKS